MTKQMAMLANAVSIGAYQDSYRENVNAPKVHDTIFCRLCLFCLYVLLCSFWQESFLVVSRCSNDFSTKPFSIFLPFLGYSFWTVRGLSRTQRNNRIQWR